MHPTLFSFHLHALARWYERTGTTADDVILAEMRQAFGCYAAFKLVFSLYCEQADKREIWEIVSKSKAVVFPSDSGLWLARMRVMTSDVLDSLQLGVDVMTFCDEGILRPNQEEAGAMILEALKPSLDRMVDIGLLLDGTDPPMEATIDAGLVDALLLMLEREDLEPESRDHITRFIDDQLQVFEKQQLVKGG